MPAWLSASASPSLYLKALAIGIAPLLVTLLPPIAYDLDQHGDRYVYALMLTGDALFALLGTLTAGSRGEWWVATAPMEFILYIVF